MLKGLGGLGDMAKMMKQAQEMQGKMAQMQDEAVRRQYPTYNDAQVMRELIKRQYGSKILDDIDNHQNKRRND